LIGSPVSVFDRQFHRSSIGGLQGVCKVPSKSSYDTNDGVLSVSLSWHLSENPLLCNQVLAPDLIGVGDAYGDHNFNFDIDFRSIITAVAINMYSLNVWNLVHVPALDRTFTVGNTTIIGGAYYDPKHSG
jgi:hypothetical protein